MGVRFRISAISRRFEGKGGFGAWECFRLIQAAFLPVIYYGLEFIGDFGFYLKRIQIAVNDTFRHIFRLPSHLPIDMMLADFGLPPVRCQARYLQR